MGFGVWGLVSRHRTEYPHHLKATARLAGVLAGSACPPSCRQQLRVRSLGVRLHCQNVKQPAGWWQAECLCVTPACWLCWWLQAACLSLTAQRWCLEGAAWRTQGCEPLQGARHLCQCLLIARAEQHSAGQALARVSVGVACVHLNVCMLPCALPLVGQRCSCSRPVKAPCLAHKLERLAKSPEGWALALYSLWPRAVHLSSPSSPVQFACLSRAVGVADLIAWAWQTSCCVEPHSLQSGLVWLVGFHLRVSFSASKQALLPALCWCLQPRPLHVVASISRSAVAVETVDPAAATCTHAMLHLEGMCWTDSHQRSAWAATGP